MHPFEKSNLGIAPFKLEKVELADTSSGFDTCDHCRTRIRYVHWITSNDGNLFKVGSSCVMKTNDEQLKSASKAELAYLKDWLKLSPEQREAEREFFANCIQLKVKR